MKKLSFAVLLASQLLMTNTFADEAKPAEPTAANPSTAPAVLPKEEKAFVKAINNFDKKAIIAQLGEPAKSDDIKLKKSGKIIASIWQYHGINIAEDGSTYQTTELDFVDDKVVQVVFLNNDGSERPGSDNEQMYQLPQGAPQPTMPQEVMPEEPLPEIK
jgi:hypothetical protein